MNTKKNTSNGNLGIIVGIDASRNRSGGAIAHLVGILSNGDPRRHGIQEVHVWAYKALLDAIPYRKWLIKHDSDNFGASLPMQLLWQATRLSHEANLANCDILFTTDASTFCRFKPMVVMSQDMLSYEPNVMGHLGFGKNRLRAISILLLQNSAFRHAESVIFLTHHTGKLIQNSCGILPKVAYIPHGIGLNFKQAKPIQSWPENGNHAIQCLYVSPIWEFKHQWVLVRGIKILRNRGYNVFLTLIGSGSGKAMRLLERQIVESDPRGEFVHHLGSKHHKEIPTLMSKADLFVFASSCENMPITLLEAMSVGLPIASSDRGPMPEILQNGGTYFNPHDDNSIADSIEKIIINPKLRESISTRAKSLASQYSWKRCSTETFTFIANTYTELGN